MWTELRGYLGAFLCALLIASASRAAPPASADHSPPIPPRACSAGPGILTWVETSELPLVLGRSIAVKATGDVCRAIKSKIATPSGGGSSALTLVLDGVALPDLPRSWGECDDKGDSLCIQFDLIRDSNNDVQRTQWNALLTKLHSGPSKLEVRLAIDNDVPLWVDAASRQTPNGSGGVSTYIVSPTFQVSSTLQMIAAAVSTTLIVLIGFGLAIASPTLLRNSGTSCYSLSKTQFAFWGILVFACFVGVYVLSFGMEHIPLQVLALMGISAATGLSGVLIGTGDDLATLWQAKQTAAKNLAGTLAPRDETPMLPAGAAALAGDAATKATQRAQAISDERAQALSATASVMAWDGSVPKGEKGSRVAYLNKLLALADGAVTALVQSQPTDQPTVVDVWKLAKAAAKAYFATTYSNGLLSDICNDGDGISFHRVQVVIWTALLGVVFVVTVLRVMSMPEFSETLLTLMGISNAAYLGYKTQGK